MPSTGLSAATLGIDAYPVHVEVDTDRTLPTFTVVGLPDSTVRKSKERVLAAIKNAGYQWPRRRVTVNLAPADRRKEGSAFDLPIALGVLVASKQIKPVRLGDFALLGELSLNGSVRPVHGMLSMADSLHQHGLYGMIVPTQNAREAATADGPLVYGVSTLQEAVEILAGDVRQRPYELNVDDVFREHGCYPIDFAEVRGQDHAKRAVEVAGGGGHSLLMVGPPAAGHNTWVPAPPPARRCANRRRLVDNIVGADIAQVPAPERGRGIFVGVVATAQFNRVIAAFGELVEGLVEGPARQHDGGAAEFRMWVSSVSRHKIDHNDSFHNGCGDIAVERLRSAKQPCIAADPLTPITQRIINR